MKQKLLGISAITMTVLAAPLVLTSCWVDSGKTEDSSVVGYSKYKNKTIGISVLSPDGWKAEVGIGGVYTLTAPEQGGAQVYVMSSTIEDMMNGKQPKNAGLDDYKKYRLSQTTEDVLGLDLKHSIKKSSLAGLPAYTLETSYKSASDGSLMHTRSTFTYANGRVYSLEMYTPKPMSSHFKKVYEMMLGSYKLLK